MASRASKPLTPEEKMAKIQRALARTDGSQTWETVVGKLVSGEYQMIDSEDGVCITQIVDSPRGRYLWAWLVAGQLPGLITLQNAVERHAISNSCSHILAQGRLGWAELAKSHGWKIRDVTFIKEISNAS